MDLFRQNRTNWEIIDGRAQQILKGRSVLGSNDHSIKTITIQYKYTETAALEDMEKGIEFVGYM